MDGDVLIVESPKKLKKVLKTTMEIYRKRLEENGERKHLGIMIWGGIGCGKSDIVYQSTEEIYGDDATICEMRGSLLEPSDVLGIPTVKLYVKIKKNDKIKAEGTYSLFDKELIKTLVKEGIVEEIKEGATVFNPPSLLPRSGKGIIFLDEINLAPISVQHALYQLILNRQIGEYRVPKTFQIVAAGNERLHRASVHEMPAPLKNRFNHIKILEPTRENMNLSEWIDEWTEYMISQNRDRRVIVYLNQFRERLYTFDPNKTERAFATPRTWEEVAINIEGIEDLDKVEMLTAMAVGSGIAKEFVAWINISREFDIEAVLEDPNKLDFNEMPADKKYAFVLALANTFIPKYEKKPNKELISNMIEIMYRIDVEFRVLLIRLLKSSKKVTSGLIQNPDFARKLGKTLDYL